MINGTLLGILFTLITPTKAAPPTWMIILSKESAVNICGNASIQNTESGLKKNFFLGNPKKGYVFTELPSYDKYWKILKENNLEAAQTKIKSAFSRTALWEIGPDGKTRYLGTPKTVETMFKATVKDCVEGAEKTIGGTCTEGTIEQKSACCREKFTGPVITWKYQEVEYKLDYSPDPSVALTISNSNEPRFCHVKESFGK